MEEKVKEAAERAVSQAGAVNTVALIRALNEALRDERKQRREAEVRAQKYADLYQEYLEIAGSEQKRAEAAESEVERWKAIARGLEMQADENYRKYLRVKGDL